MRKQQDVEVFISWSGELSKSVAKALRQWLPLLFDRVKPWMSDIDIAAGQRGLRKIERRLQNAKFGIIVVTAENGMSPWLHFEAGALSKATSTDGKLRVVPVLADLTSPSDLKGPLSQFQAISLDYDGTRELVRSLADAAGIAPFVADQRFAMSWGRLADALDSAIREASGAAVDVPVARTVREELVVTAAMTADEQRALMSLVNTRLDRRTMSFLNAEAEKLGVSIWRAYRSDEKTITLLIGGEDVPTTIYRKLKATLTTALDQDIDIQPAYPELDES